MPKLPNIYGSRGFIGSTLMPKVASIEHNYGGVGYRRNYGIVPAIVLCISKIII